MSHVAERRAYVRNAADPQQVKRAKETEGQRRDRELAELRDVLSTLSGRRVLWRFLAKCRTYESIMETSARIYYNAGQQDLGHYLQGEIGLADPDAFILMMQDARKMEQHIVEPAARSDEPFETVEPSEAVT